MGISAVEAVAMKTSIQPNIIRRPPTNKPRNTCKPPKAKNNATPTTTQNRVHNCDRRCAVNSFLSGRLCITRYVKPSSSICCWAACLKKFSNMISSLSVIAILF